MSELKDILEQEYELSDTEKMADFINRAEYWLKLFGQKTGKSLLVLESSWWSDNCWNGNFTWTRFVFADVELTDSGKGVVAKRAVSAGHVTSKLSTVTSIREEMLDDRASGYSGRSLQNQIRSNTRRAFNPDRVKESHRLGDCDTPLPKSKVVYRQDFDGPEDCVVFTPDGSHSGRRSDAEVTIMETTTVWGKHKQYSKLAIDSPHEASDDIKSLDWGRYHVKAKWNGDDFECWTADLKPRQVAQEIADRGWNVAVAKDLYRDVVAE